MHSSLAYPFVLGVQCFLGVALLWTADLSFGLAHFPLSLLFQVAGYISNHEMERDLLLLSIKSRGSFDQDFSFGSWA